MRNTLLIAFATLAVLFLILTRARKRVEGFAAIPHVRQGNYVLDLLGRLKKTSRTLANPGLWKERMAMMGKTPVELAREYIKSQAKQDNAA